MWLRLRLENEHRDSAHDDENQPGQERGLELVERAGHRGVEQRVDDGRPAKHQWHHIDRFAAEVQGENHPQRPQRPGTTGQQAPEHPLPCPATPFATASEQRQRNENGQQKIGDAHAHERPQGRSHSFPAEVEHRSIQPPAERGQGRRGEHAEQLHHDEDLQRRGGGRGGKRLGAGAIRPRGRAATRRPAAIRPSYAPPPQP